MLAQIEPKDRFCFTGNNNLVIFPLPPGNQSTIRTGYLESRMHVAFQTQVLGNLLRTNLGDSYRVTPNPDKYNGLVTSLTCSPLDTAKSQSISMEDFIKKAFNVRQEDIDVGADIGERHVRIPGTLELDSPNRGIEFYTLPHEVHQKNELLNLLNSRHSQHSQLLPSDPSTITTWQSLWAEKNNDGSFEIHISNQKRESLEELKHVHPGTVVRFNADGSSPEIEFELAADSLKTVSPEFIHV